MKTTIYLEQLFPGSMVAETSTREVTGDLKLRKGAIGYRLYSVDTVIIDGEEFKKDPVYQKWTYIGESIFIEDAPEGSILKSNMEMNDWHVVVKTRGGTFPVSSSDQIITADEIAWDDE